MLYQGQQLTNHRTALRIGGLCAIVGSLIVFGFRLAHGDPPAADAEANLRFIADHPAYAGVHLGTILGVLAWVAGFIALSDTLTRGYASRLLGRLGITSLLVGAATVIGATALLLEPELFPGVVVYGLLASVAVQVWSLALGVMMWRRGGLIPEQPLVATSSAQRACLRAAGWRG